jgi:hypothetical protein
MEDDFDDLTFWFSFHQRMLEAKELLFSRKDPVACYNSISQVLYRSSWWLMLKSQNFCWKVIIFMTLLSGNINRTIVEWCQHRPSTILAIFHEVIDIFLKKDMVDCLMIPPDSEEIPTKIRSNPKFSPFFGDCVANFYQIPAVVEESEKRAFRNCKSFISKCVGCD